MNETERKELAERWRDICMAEDDSSVLAFLESGQYDSLPEKEMASGTSFLAALRSKLFYELAPVLFAPGRLRPECPADCIGNGFLGYAAAICSLNDLRILAELVPGYPGVAVSREGSAAYRFCAFNRITKEALTTIVDLAGSPGFEIDAGSGEFDAFAKAAVRAPKEFANAVGAISETGYSPENLASSMKELFLAFAEETATAAKTFFDAAERLISNAALSENPGSERGLDDAEFLLKTLASCSEGVLVFMDQNRDEASRRVEASLRDISRMREAEETEIHP